MFAAFSPDGQRVITGDVGIAAVKIWDLSLEGDAEVVNVPTDELLGPVDVGYLPDGRIVASHDRGSVAVWDVRSDATAPDGDAGPRDGASEDPVFLVAPSPDGELVAMVRDVSSVVSVWNVETNALAFDFDVAARPISSIDWSGDGRYLALGVYDGSLHVLDADDDGRHTLVGSEPDPRDHRASPSRRTVERSPPRPSTTRSRTRATCRSGIARRARSFGSSTM